MSITGPLPPGTGPLQPVQPPPPPPTPEEAAPQAPAPAGTGPLTTDTAEVATGGPTTADRREDAMARAGGQGAAGFDAAFDTFIDDASTEAADAWRARKADLDAAIGQATLEQLPALYEQLAGLQAEARALPPSARDAVATEAAEVDRAAAALGRVLPRLKAAADDPLGTAIDAIQDPATLDALKADLAEIQAAGGLGAQLAGALERTITEYSDPAKLFELLKAQVEKDPAGAAEKVLDVIAGRLGIKDGVDALKGLFSGGKDAFEALMKGDMDAFRKALPGMGENLATLVKSFKKLGDFVDKLMAKIPAGVRALADRIIGPIRAVLGVTGSAIDLYNTLRDDAKRTIGNVADASLDFFKHLAGIASAFPPFAPAAKAIQAAAEKGQDLLDKGRNAPLGLGSQVQAQLDQPAPFDVDLPALPYGLSGVEGA